MFKENIVADQNWKGKTEKQNAPSLKTFGIKRLENQDYISQYMRSQNPPDVWQWLSTEENGKHHGRCLPAKKSAIPVTHSISKRKHSVFFPCQKSTAFSGKNNQFSPPLHRWLWRRFEKGAAFHPQDFLHVAGGFCAAEEESQKPQLLLDFPISLRNRLLRAALPSASAPPRLRGAWTAGFNEIYGIKKGCFIQ